MAKWTKNETAEAIAILKEILQPGDAVYTIVKSVAKSGMSRTISCYVIKDNEPRWISRLVAKATDSNYDDDKEAVKIGGCGMDLGFALVYELSRALFPDGFAPMDHNGRVVGIRPVDGKTVNVDIGKHMRNDGPVSLDKRKIEYLRGQGWKFPNGRNRDDSGWDNDGGYALKQRWL